ncbi:ubiquitin-protein ligase [Saccharomycopsis crataegensis]|uniref:Ubiquitin-protein ligase n=1 Tax=Saccharomycopsis crataegensis TaxID=43959 RepID=A0AAV5QKG2_9ASCO|nr:ubiquitin-protein ligase [Saccharomycopsis crataegensis]
MSVPDNGQNNRNSDNAMNADNGESQPQSQQFIIFEGIPDGQQQQPPQQGFNFLWNSQDMMNDDTWGGISNLGRLLASLMFMVNEPKKKKHASQRALDSLKAVDLSELSEADRLCPICFDHFEGLKHGKRNDNDGSKENIDDHFMIIDSDEENEDSDDEAMFMDAEDPGVMLPASITGQQHSTYRIEDDPVYRSVQSKKEKEKKDEVPENHVAVRMPCNHVFGESCIREWLKKEVTCPLCRKEVESDEAGDENADSSGGRRSMTLYSFQLSRGYINGDYSRAGEGHAWNDPELALPEEAQGSGPILGASIVPRDVGIDRNNQSNNNNNNDNNNDNNNNDDDNNNNNNSSNNNNDNDNNANDNNNNGSREVRNSYQQTQNNNVSGSDGSVNLNNSQSNPGDPSNDNLSSEPQNGNGRSGSTFSFPRLFFQGGPLGRFSSALLGPDSSTLRSGTNGTGGGPVRSSRQNSNNGQRTHPYFRTFIINANTRQRNDSSNQS